MLAEIAVLTDAGRREIQREESAAALFCRQLQRTRANTLLTVSCGFVPEDFARQATKPSGRTSAAPFAVIPYAAAKLFSGS
jgi:hypothetical protein